MAKWFVFTPNGDDGPIVQPVVADIMELFSGVVRFSNYSDDETETKVIVVYGPAGWLKVVPANDDLEEENG